MDRPHFQWFGTSQPVHHDPEGPHPAGFASITAAVTPGERE
ncbi:hypothetical protein I551_7889 [Mycobacterium ulcerans str. Harvey]|uniref:Uncharacterized protein n=1 Tax=Mycobacterium ulcerans str. Harvey TaxID=1299332 RepID=A0ABP3A4I2_MYCUL|nr:hypothetical protein I551_7889 [Mycobacterium ulcerans str. Harvey]